MDKQGSNSKAKSTDSNNKSVNDKTNTKVGKWYWYDLSSENLDVVKNACLFHALQPDKVTMSHLE